MAAIGGGGNARFSGSGSFMDSDIAALDLMASDGDDAGNDDDVDDLMGIPPYDSDGEGGGEEEEDYMFDGDDKMLAADHDDGDEGRVFGYMVSDASSSGGVYSPCGAGEGGARVKQQEMEISPSRRKATTQSTASTKAAAVTTTTKKKKKTAKKSLAAAAAALEDGMKDAGDAAKPIPAKPRARQAAGASPDDDKQRELKMAAMAKRKQASIDQRRKRNREAMQRARQRDKDYMDGLRDTAHDLERKHNALLATVNAQIAVISTSGQVNGRVNELQHKLQVARDQAEELKRQNLQFLDEIGDRIKREDRMEGLLRELMREQQAQEEMLNDIFRESLSESQMSVFYTEDRAMRVMVRSRSDMRQVERQGFEKRAVCGDLFGWSTQYRYEGNLFFFSFTKTFRNRNTAHVMETNWANELKMVTYRNSVEAATQRWHTLQKINDDTYLIARETRDPDRGGEYVRLLYLRFRLHEADGSYSVVTQSVNQEYALHEDVDEIWATKACSWTLFTPVLEHFSDGSVQEHCQIKIVGKSTIGSEKTARENILETIMGLLRWENINVGPTLSLTNV